MAEVGIGGGLNTFVPTFSAATGQIQIEFTRSPNKFALTRYAQIVPVQAMAGYFLRIDEEETARVVQTQDNIWPLGLDRPTGINSDFDFVSYACARYQSSFHIPQETARQAQWDVVASHARIAAAKMMTLRGYRAANLISTDTSYASANRYTSYSASNGPGHYSNATALINNNVIGSTPATDGVQELFRTAVEKIVQATNAAVSPSDICAVLNPNTARQLAGTDGVRDYVKNYPAALNFLQGDAQFATYGLPSQMFGVNVVVDDTVRVTNRKGATKSTSFFYGSQAAPGIAFVSRPGGMVGNEGPSFSTVTIFAYEDMTVETLDDPWNRRIRGSVTDNSAIELTAPLAAVYVADLAS
jgi:hypothetical protein